jgi:hypothetical protein
MNTSANIIAIFENAAKKFIELGSKINEATNSYDFEKAFKSEMSIFSQSVYQSIIGDCEVDKNNRMKLMTSLGEVVLNKSHPLAVSPGGFKISAYLQEQMCRLGTKMTFEESQEELKELLEIETNAKQIERLCHHYGEELSQIDWHQAYWEGIQLHIPFHRQLYVLIDGSMLLTRDKEQAWKEVKLCRMFYDTERIEPISKNRNMLTDSRYVAHLGGHQEFLDKVLDVIPSGKPPVFIADGAKWIWNWVEDYYPQSIQILDYYHCKEHIYAFAKEYFTKQEISIWVEDATDKLKTQRVDIFLKELEELTCKNEVLLKSKNKLLNYLTNNKKRINYGKFIDEGLWIGSGAIESANREVIQKRMKLSGQRWTEQGAKQMLNLRTCYKSGKQKLIKNLIAPHYKLIA